MKKTISSILILLSVFVFKIQAQSVDSPMMNATALYSKIAFLNSNDILDIMPERIAATAKLEDLNKKYKDELLVIQNEYNKKYSDYISYQSSMAENIRLRRMQELYELERHMNEFMELAQKDVEEQEKKLMQPLRKKLKEAINKVGTNGAYVCIYDLANPTIVFVTPDGTDITEMVKAELRIK